MTKPIDQMTHEETIVELTRLRELTAPKVKQPKTDNGLKISEDKGCLMYFFSGKQRRRFPVTLYANEWEQLLDKAEYIKAFIEANKTKLTWKQEATDEVTNQVEVG